MKRYIVLGLLLITTMACADIADVPVTTTIVPEKTYVNWKSNSVTVTAGQKIAVAILETDGSTLESKVFTIPAGKTFTGVMKINGELMDE